MMIFLFACTTTEQKSSLPDTQGDSLIVVTAAMDYSVGSLAQIDLSRDQLFDDVASVSGDAVVVWDQYLWQLNRYQYDTLRKYSPENLSQPLQEISLAPEIGSANPHDVAICGGQLFISLYEQSVIPLYDVETLSLLEEIDISAYADADGKTEASTMVVVDEKLYVGLQGLDRNQGFSSVGSTILEIDCLEKRIRQSWDMGQNIKLYSTHETKDFIFSSLSWSGEEEYPTGVFSFSPADGDVELLHSVEDRTIENLAVSDKHIVYLSAEEDYSAYYLECLSLEDGNVQSSTARIEYLTDIAFDREGGVWVSAHWGWNDISSAQPGLYRTQIGKCQLDEAHFNFSLAPVDFVLVPKE